MEEEKEDGDKDHNDVEEEEDNGDDGDKNVEEDVVRRMRRKMMVMRMVLRMRRKLMRMIGEYSTIIQISLGCERMWKCRKKKVDSSLPEVDNF